MQVFIAIRLQTIYHSIVRSHQLAPKAIISDLAQPVNQKGDANLVPKKEVQRLSFGSMILHHRNRKAKVLPGQRAAIIHPCKNADDHPQADNAIFTENQPHEQRSEFTVTSNPSGLHN